MAARGNVLKWRRRVGLQRAGHFGLRAEVEVTAARKVWSAIWTHVSYQESAARPQAFQGRPARCFPARTRRPARFGQECVVACTRWHAPGVSTRTSSAMPLCCLMWRQLGGSKGGPCGSGRVTERRGGKWCKGDTIDSTGGALRYRGQIPSGQGSSAPGRGATFPVLFTSRGTEAAKGRGLARQPIPAGFCWTSIGARLCYPCIL
jgi:hypothetical protein